MLRRFQTGWRDGEYTLPSGHLEGSETVREAACREATEEVGVTVKPEDLTFRSVIMRKAEEGDHERVDFFFDVMRYEGTLHNNEPEKCDKVGWFEIQELPVNTVPPVSQALDAIDADQIYVEHGWD
jgi:ADP-ribose pyrophosphatase YjhB (NUDIX family)